MSRKKAITDVKDLDGDNGSAGESNRVRCVVNFCGPTDFAAFVKRSPGMNQPGKPVYKLFGGPVEEKAEAAKSASPVTFASKDDPPFLTIHGDEDRTVPFEQAELLHTALKKAGVDSTLVKVEGGGHGFGGPEVNRRVRAFFDKHLLGKDVEVPETAIKQEKP